MTEKTGRIPIIGAAVAGIAASLCCVVPMVLVLAGLGGAWLGTLSALEPLRPLFILMTTAFLGWGWYRLYRLPAACALGQACAVPAGLKRQRIIFWTAAAVIAVLLAFPWYAPLIL